MRIATTIIAAALALAACDEKKPETTSAPPTAAVGDARPAGKFAVELKVSGTQEVYQLEGAPKPDEVQERLIAAIQATPAFDPDGPRKLQGLITYDIKPLSEDGGHDLVLLGSLNSPDANFSAGVNLRSTDEQWKDKPVADMVAAAIQTFADRIGAQARVVGGDDDALGIILADDDESHDAKLMAIQEMRERRVTKHLEVLRTYLAAGRASELRLAAAATLVSLGDTQSRGEIIAVAEDFSRERDPQYVPMLHILGDLGGAEVVTYLEAVAEGHAAPAVRAVAREALDAARKQP